MPDKLGVYIRRSKDEVNQKSIKEQELLGIECAKDNSFEAEIFNEGIISGVKGIEQRPEFKRLLESVKNKELHGVFIWNTDRLARNAIAMLTLADAMRENSCFLYDNGVKADFSDPNTYLFYTIKAGMDEHFANITSHKIKAVLKRNVSEGKTRGIYPYGYTKDDKGYMVIDSEEAEIIKRIYDLSLKGNGQGKIAEILNNEGIPTRYNIIGEGTVTTTNQRTGEQTIKKKSSIKWSSKAIQGIIKNPVYRGERTFSGKVYECPAIFTPEYWQKVNDNLENNRNSGGKEKHYNYLLKGILICLNCGRNYYGVKKNRGKKSYAPSNFYMCSSKRHKELNCGNRAINIDAIENFIWQRFFVDKELTKLVKEHLSNDGLNTKIKAIQGEVETLNKKLNDLTAQRKNALKLAVMESVNENDLKEQFERIDRESNNIKNQISELKNQLLTLQEGEKLEQDIKRNLNKLKYDTDFITKREIILKYIKTIDIIYINKYYFLTVSFNLPIGMEYFIIDKNYRYAVQDINKRIEIPLRDENYTINENEITEAFNILNKEAEEIIKKHQTR